MSDNLELKKHLIINSINLGMDLNKAFILSECTQKEIEAFENDESFIKEIEINQAIFEKQLLERHSEACLIAAEKGNTTGLQWMLGNINPERWGPRKEELSTENIFIITKDDEKVL